MSSNRFDQVLNIAEQVRQEYGKRYTTKRGQLSEVVKLTAELSELKADKRRSMGENGKTFVRAQEIEARLANIQGQKQQTLDQMFKEICKA